MKANLHFTILLFANTRALSERQNSRPKSGLTEIVHCILFRNLQNFGNTKQPQSAVSQLYLLLLANINCYKILLQQQFNQLCGQLLYY